MPDYSKGKIYALRSMSRPDLVCIGSTIQTLSKRLGGYVSDYKRYLAGKSDYITGFEIIKLNDYYIELVEEYPCKNVMQLKRREGQVIRETDCVNKNIAGRTRQEWCQDNKERISNWHRQYRQENRERLLEQKRQYYQENKERSRQYNQENKEKITERHRQYYHNNKERLGERSRQYNQENKERLKIKIYCVCGTKISKRHINEHKKSKKHHDKLLKVLVHTLGEVKSHNNRE